MRVDAVVMAGRLNDGALKDASDAICEALIDINGRPMIDYVISALEQAIEVERIVVIGPGDHLASLLGQRVTLVEAGSTITENLRRGVAALARRRGGRTEYIRPVLICSGDVPFVTGQSISRFLELCAKREAVVYYPIIPRAACDEKFPGVKRTYVTLKEGTFTGGNLFLVNPSAMGDLLRVMESFFAARKNPLKLARLLGFGILARLLLGRLSFRDVERVFIKLFGQPGVAIPCDCPEIGVDVDKPSDLALAREVLGGAN